MLRGAGACTELGMSGPSTSREALILEALGEVGKLLDEVDRLTITMEAGREALRQIIGLLGDQVRSFETAVLDMSKRAERGALEHIVRRTNEMTRRVLEEQSQAMRDAASQAFAEQLRPTMAQLDLKLRQLMQGIERPWADWMMHAATATGSAMVTFFVITMASK